MVPSELAFLQALVWNLPPHPIAVEVGSWKGRSTTAICEALEVTGGRLIAIDTFQGMSARGWRTSKTTVRTPPDSSG